MDCLASTGSGTDWVFPALIALVLIATGVVLLRKHARRARRAAAAGTVALALLVGIGLAAQAPSSSFAALSSCGSAGSSGQQAPGDQEHGPNATPTSVPTATAASTPAPTATATPTPTATPTTEPIVSFSIVSDDWSRPTVPAQDACSSLAAPGSGRSPAVSWSNPPANTVAYAVKLVDLDANFLHWEVLNIPAGTTSLAAGASGGLTPPAAELRNDFGQLGYGGPCPPPGASHHYSLMVYALSRLVTSDGDIASAALGQAQLMSTYAQ